MSLVSRGAVTRSSRPLRNASHERRRPRGRRLASLLAIAALLAQAVPVLAADVIVEVGPIAQIAVDTGSSGESYVGFNESDTHPNPQDLTAAGLTDWRVWGRSSTELQGDDHKLGGSGISNLTNISAGDAIPLRALGTLGILSVGTGINTMPFSFSWTDGTSTASATAIKAGLQHDAPVTGSVGYGFSFTVPAGPGSHTLKVWASAHHGTGLMTADLGAGGGSDTDAAVTGGQNHGGVYTITFTGDSTPGRVLTVTYVLDSVNDTPDTDPGCGTGCPNDFANVVVYAAALDNGVVATPDFSFGTPSAGATDAAPLGVQQGQSNVPSTVPVTLLNGAASVATSVAIIPSGQGVTVTTGPSATTSATVNVSATAGADPGNYVVTLHGVVGSVSHDAIIYVNVPAPAAVGVPLLTNAYNAPLSTTTKYAGHISASPSTTYNIVLAAAATCANGVFPVENGLPFGTPIPVTTDPSGNAFFNGEVTGVPGAGRTFIAAHVSGPGGQHSGYSPCVVNSPDNDVWPRALDISSNLSPTVGTTIDQPGVARWFKVHVVPGGSVAVDVSGLSADYDVYLFKDIAQTYNALNTESDLTKLSAEFAGSGFSGSGFSGSGFSGSGFSGSGFSGSGFSGSGFSGSGFSPDSYSGSGFSGSGFSGSGFSGSGFSGSGFSGSGFSGSGFSGSGFSGSGFSPESFSAAQVYSLVAWSNNLGTATEHTAANTWTNTGDYYIRVNGKNGVASLEHPFALNVTVNSSNCSNVHPIGSAPAQITNTYDTVILTDTSRFNGASTTAMITTLNNLATSTNGVVVDLNAPGRVRDLQAQADSYRGCVYAKNLVASAAKDVVDAYRNGNTTTHVKYVVLAGGDNVLPFFRYPDTSSIGPEVSFFPPVDSASPSEASLRSNYVLGQDAYGSSRSLSIGPVNFPIPELPVGRLVETPTEIAGMAQAYLDQSTVIPHTSLVTAYDFIADAANTPLVGIKPNLDAGTGEAGGGHSLIDLYGTSPANGWTATQLKAELFGRRNDITFLGGHFSASSALAADFSSVVTTDDFAASATAANFKNTIIFSIGCHSGYNVVDAQGIPNVTKTLDWSQAFAQKQVTSILGTGYQYGDTDFIEYSERIYTEFSRQLRYGSGAVAIGNALVASKVQYLEQTPGLGDLHVKALLESALYGLPMLGVNLPAGRLIAPTTSGTVPIGPVAGDPGATTGLKFYDLNQSTPSQIQTKTLNVQGGGSLTATWYKSPTGGVHTTPGAPVLPLYSVPVTPAGGGGYVLRGIGFLGGGYSDSSVTPLSGAPGFELQTAHTSFGSPTFYPTQMWTANYFDALTGGGGATTLFLTPAQHRAANPGADTVTLRKYSNLSLRLFYSSSTGDGSRSAAPVIYGITSDLQAGNTLIAVHVVGDPKADVQQAWVAYTAPGSGLWQSLNLTRDGSDPTLWKGSAALVAGTQFFVQAVNGFGLVSQNDNTGAYYQAGVPASTPAASSIALSGASSGVFGTNASITATLTSSGSVSSKQVVLTLGSVTRSGTTNGSGQVTVQVPLSAAAAVYPLAATFYGDASVAPASASSLFTITPATSAVTVTCPVSVTYNGAPQTPCTAKATGVGGLNQPLSVSYSPNVNVGTVTATAAFFGDAAHVPGTGSATFKILWPFTGFFPPVDNPPTVNKANAGQAIPIKFSLGGDRGLDIFKPGWPKAIAVSCDASAPGDDIETYASSTSGLSYGGGQYTYVWKTDKSLAGKCVRFELGLKDGSTIPVANFKFK